MADTQLKALQTKLRDIDFTALDYETIQTELIEYLKIAQTNNGLVDDFSSGDAAKMFIDLISYLGDILAFRLDTLSSENYLPTAQRRQSLVNILELVAQRPKNPTASTLTINVVPLTITNSNIFVPIRYPFEATGLDGNTVSFEIMNGPFDYFSQVQIPSNVTNFNLKAYSGTYRVYDVISNGDPNQKIVLPDYPVIDGSVRVSVTNISPSLLTPTIIESTRIEEVLTLINSDNKIFYTLKYDADGRAIISLPTEKFGKIPNQGDTIHIDYRVGGGLNTNVPVGSVSVQTSFAISNGTNIDVSISNPDTFGVGGQDAEDVNVIRLRAPGLVRANDKLTTTDDYESVIGGLDGVQDVFAVDRFTDQNIYNGRYAVPQNSVFVYVLPTTGGEVSPDLRQNIYYELEKRRLTAINNFVFNPVYVDWVLNIAVTVKPTYDADVVRQNIIEALVATFGRDITSFKTQVYLSQISAIVQNVEGVAFSSIGNPTANLISLENEALRLLENNIVISISQL